MTHAGTQELCMMITMVNAIKGMSENLNDSAKSINVIDNNVDDLFKIVKLQQIEIQKLKERLNKLEKVKKK